VKTTNVYYMFMTKNY